MIWGEYKDTDFQNGENIALSENKQIAPQKKN